MIKKDIKEMYDFVLNNYSKAEYGKYPIVECPLPVFFCDDKQREEKMKLIYKRDIVFHWELTDKATEQDYLDYIDFILNYCGTTREEVFKK